jgi:CBS domain-containing protein
MLDRTVSEYMTSPVVSVGPDETLPAIAKLLDERRISAVVVIDERAIPLGIVSRSDLLRIGRSHTGASRGARALELPAWRVGEVMTQGTLSIAPNAPLAEAARTMREERCHRLVVIEAGRLAGVFSTLDLAAAVRDAHVTRPLAEIMSTPVITVEATRPVSVAIEKLDEAHLTGVIVVEDEWPIGVFTQSEAIAVRDLPSDTPVGDLLDPAIICLPAQTRCHRAAAHIARLDVRRVIACRGGEMVGIVTGFDIAKLFPQAGARY